MKPIPRDKDAWMWKPLRFCPEPQRSKRHEIPIPPYIALIDGKPGAYGVVFPDAPGCAAMGDTIQEALLNARVALKEWIADSRQEGLGVPEPRTVDELLKDPDVIEQIAETDAVMREVAY